MLKHCHISIKYCLSLNKESNKLLTIVLEIVVDA